ncbi:MAG TPA: paraquat-inducible protein A, partial [Epsilonproteobacteria bacterium]|nr:paraquat-inducible protein A [Campylobacterota bacterium]
SLTAIGLFLLSGTTVTLLVSGIILPMLDIEAKIAKLYFTILDHPIVFENQILFFQSKSISDLVRLLLDSDEVKMIFVGILLVMFSIIFPTLKLIATTMYFYSKSIIGDNPITRFFALKSTKWSMADVFVVSIFMAYLGLDGVVSSELKHLEAKSTPMNVITTNATHLEVGFFLFLGFVLTSFVLALMVERKRKKD